MQNTTEQRKNTDRRINSNKIDLSLLPNGEERRHTQRRANEIICISEDRRQGDRRIASGTLDLSKIPGGKDRRKNHDRRIHSNPVSLSLIPQTGICEITEDEE